MLVAGKLVAIVDAVAGSCFGVRSSDIRRATSLPESTCFRLIGDLVTLGVLERDRATYRLGPTVSRWMARASLDAALDRCAPPVLAWLRDLTQETALLFRRDGAHRRVVAKAPTPKVVMCPVRVGQRLPLHAGSGGQVILAFDPRGLQLTLNRRLEHLTGKTLTDEKGLRRRLAAVRRRGYALGVEERCRGTAGISVPVFGPGGQFCSALEVAGPVDRCTPSRLREMLPHLRQAAGMLQERLGGGAGGAADDLDLQGSGGA